MIDLNDKTILVTGGCGFIGSNFIQYVNDTFTNVVIVNIDKMGVGHRKLTSDLVLTKNNQYVEVEMDITNIGNDQFPVQNKILNSMYFDYCFHFAAESHVDRSIINPSAFVYNNAYGTSVLMEYFLKRQTTTRIIHISTDEVYGHLGYDDEPFTEHTPLSPRSPYAASKASSDLIALSYHETFGMDVLVTRCCNNYGPWQHSEKFIPTILKSLKDGNKIPVYGNGYNIREWIYVEDHNKSVLEIAGIGQSGKVYNISSGVERDNIQLIVDILNLIYDDGDKLLNYVQFVEDRKGHDFRYALKSLDYERTFELTSFHDGLKKTINHYNQIL
jgi:dTDP-glucose 4,6-dehydratase